MSFHLRKDGDRYTLELLDEPHYCHALSMYADEMEEKLEHGLWLILNSAVWSVPDRKAIGHALVLIKEYRGAIELGIRPFEEDIPFIKGDDDKAGIIFTTPVWSLMKDGKLLRNICGTYQKVQTELKATIAQLIEP